MPFCVGWDSANTTRHLLCKCAGSHSPPEDRGACTPDAGRANHGAKRSYPAVFSTLPNLWTDSNRHTVGAFCERPRATAGRPYTFKIYLQSHRCNGILDRFGLTKHLKCLQNCGIMKVRKAVELCKTLKLKSYHLLINIESN